MQSFPPGEGVCADSATTPVLAGIFLHFISQNLLCTPGLGTWEKKSIFVLLLQFQE